jgi:hypothetical protein
MIVPNTNQLTFVYLDDANKTVDARVVAFDVDDSKTTVKAITWPSVPKGARCFVYDGGYRAFDPATGIVSGPASLQPE